MRWSLRVRDHNTGSVADETVETPTVHVGRDPNSDILLRHDRVSRRHLELSANDDGTVSVQDWSSNGTFYRRDDDWVRIAGTQDLTPPFVLRIAHWTLKINAPQPVEEQEDEQPWDQSVMIPAASLGHRIEAILVLDLCGSSMIASENDHMAYHLKQRLTQIAEPILNEFGCRFFKSTGDGFLATFESAERAQKAAVKLEDHVQYRNKRTTNVPIHYRIALHHGEVWAISAGGDDVHGNDVNITFRIEGVQAAAFGEMTELFPKENRILCSGDFHRLVAASPEPGTGYVRCGTADLKGINEPVEIFWLKTEYSSEDLDTTLALGH